jgi:MATE family multidrug resistance protein
MKDRGLTSGNLRMNIWQISWPMLLIMILQFFVGFTDVFVAGLISSEVQAVVGFISQLFFLFIILGNAVSIGAVSMVARAIGADDFTRALSHAKQSLIFGLSIAAVLTVVTLLGYREIIVVLGFPAEIRTTAETFLVIFAFALVPNYILIISNAVFRASGEVLRPLFTMCVVSAVNIIGDFGLVFGYFPFPELGFPGIAVATTVASAIGMGINLAFLMHSRWRTLFRTAWSVSWSAIALIFRLSWPAAILQIAWNAGSIVLYNILGRLGEESITALASITNGLRIEAIIFLPPFALNMAASVLVGQNLGAGKPDRAEKIGWQIAWMGVGFVSAMACVIFVWADACASLLTADTAVLEETARYLRINMFSEPFMALSLVLAGGLQGAGDTRGTMWIIVVAMWMIRLPLAYYLALVAGLGAVGVWIAMITSMIIQGLLMARRFRGGHWKDLTVG